MWKTTLYESNNRIKILRKTFKDWIHMFVIGCSISYWSEIINNRLDLDQKFQNRMIVEICVTKFQSKLSCLRSSLMMKISGFYPKLATNATIQELEQASSWKCGLKLNKKKFVLLLPHQELRINAIKIMIGIRKVSWRDLRTSYETI